MSRNRIEKRNNSSRGYLAAPSLISFLVGCTGQLPGSFRYLQQNERFSSQQEINTKIDILWVVDNSASMDASQEKLRNGFQGFATKYLKPYWDIRIAVITTDTYLANTAYTEYLGTTISGTTGASSPYINTRLATFVNPSSRPNLVNTGTGAFTNGLLYNDMVPVWGPQWAKLLPGLHDGPTQGFCQERLPHFLNGPTQCSVRDAAASARGVEGCLRPGAGQSSLSQCVNTTQNDTVRTGHAILETKRAADSADISLSDEDWTTTLAERFMINATTGSVGHGSERGLSSLLQVLTDNEPTDTAFFRKDSLRVIIFISDEEDQSISIPASVPAGFQPYTNYGCDLASLQSMNTGVTLDGVNGTCCSIPGNNCRYGASGTSCGTKTVDSYTYTISVCPATSDLIPVSSVHSQLNTFFSNLDEKSEDAGSYMTVSIVPLTAATIQSLQASRNTSDSSVGVLATHAVDRGDRYIELGNLVANGSMSMDIGATDYSVLLDEIGTSIVNKKSTFPLTRAPTNEEEMQVTVVHADGTTSVVDTSLYEIVDKAIVFTSQSYVLSLKSTDQININYQPKTAY